MATRRAAWRNTERKDMEQVQERSARTTRTQHVSLDAAEARALRLLAQDERFGNVSATVGRLVRNEMLRRYGANWMTVVDDTTDGGDAAR